MTLFTVKHKTLEARIKLSRTHARKLYIAEHGGLDIPSWLEVHHVDFCPLNNEPINLKLLRKRVHIDLHSEDGDNVISNLALERFLERECLNELNELEGLLTIYNSDFCN
jgi:hypothetical protein